MAKTKAKARGTSARRTSGASATSRAPRKAQAKKTAKKAPAKSTKSVAPKKAATKKTAKAAQARKKTAKAAKNVPAKEKAAQKTRAKKAPAKKAAAKKAPAKKKAAAPKTRAKKAPAKKKAAAPKTRAKKAAQKTRAKKAGAAKKAGTETTKVAANTEVARGMTQAEQTKVIAEIEAAARAAGVELPAGASERAFAELEETLGLELPAEMRAWYLAHDGGGPEFVLESRELLSLQRIAAEWKIWKDLLDRGTFGDNAHSEPGRGVQQRWWIPEWVPVTYDGAGNHDVVDLAPGEGGQWGQVLSFWHDDPSRRVVGGSFLTWLAGCAWGGD